jgi:raffinose/stachyose/melibiose transport system substrate-binding protein
MELMGQWAPGADRGSAKDVDTFNKNLGWFPFPTVEGQKGDNSDVLGGGDGFAIGKNAPKEAIDFVRFMTSLDSQKMLTKQGVAAPPVVKGAESELSDPLLQEVMKHAAAAKYFQLYYDQFLPPAVGEAVNDKTQELFAGTASPEDVAKGIEEVAAAEMSQ